MQKRLLLTFSILYYFLLIFTTTIAQKRNYHYYIQKTSVPIIIDGKLEEEIWFHAEIADSFFQNFPFDSSFAKAQTQVQLTYDKNYLYVAVICYYVDSMPKWIAQSLRRDYDYARNDAFSVFIDPLNDHTNGFEFSVTPLGVQREGLVENGGNFGVNISWDNKWFSAVKHYKDKWIAELAIPFKTLRFKADVSTWGINFSRNDLSINENSSWVPVPRNFLVSNLAFTGTLEWDTPPTPSGFNAAFIPFTTGQFSQNYLIEPTARYRISGGADAKIGITSSLNLDLTVNPDFSQVEVDVQITNLDRFSLFFPERRNFFIENNDLFATFGFSRIRPFFSRRIGLFAGEAVPILAGARLSGKLNPNWRLGLMLMQTEKVSRLGLPPQNFFVVATQRQIFKTSNLGFILVNRQDFSNSEFSLNSSYNRVLGLDLNIFTKDSRWRGKLFYHHSFIPKMKSDMGATALWLRYSTPRWRIDYNHEYVGENYTAEVGFVPRLDLNRQAYIRSENAIAHRIYPKKGPINNHGPTLYQDQYFTRSFQITDSKIALDYIFNFINYSSLQLYYNELYTYLYFAWDPTNTGGEKLSKGSSYHYRNLGFIYNSDFRKIFYFSLGANYGSYFNGNRLNYRLEINLRLQPYFKFSLSLDRNEIELPSPYRSANIMVLNSRWDFTFTRALFLTIFWQYNTQIENININARLQWRFKPMSDLFIVLTDNFDPHWRIKNRALVVKLNYWFSV
ncbi:MAG: carbohydrate binding family 9 domain-containing protein [Bacteroidia bacterium]|nr:carbohydrate binding family 9 domain-containing protein [Bacteroidia bacterium]